jgi:transposase
MRPRDMTPAQREAFRELHRGDLKVARAWTLKEQFGAFWEYTYLRAARTVFTRWFWRASHSRLKPMAGAAKDPTPPPQPADLPAARPYQYGPRGNQRRDPVGEEARGFRNPEHFKLAIYFHCGGLDLYPHESR